MCECRDIMDILLFQVKVLTSNSLLEKYVITEISNSLTRKRLLILSGNVILLRVIPRSCDRLIILISDAIIIQYFCILFL